MRKTRIEGLTRPRKHGDLLMQQAQANLKCRLRRLFILAFLDDTREAMKAAYQLYKQRGTLAEKVRDLVYRAAHGLVSLLNGKLVFAS